MREIFEWVASVHPAAAGGEWTPVNHGGSDRRFWRGSGCAAGFVAVAIATGSYGKDELAAHQPDFLFGDLSDTQGVLVTLLGRDEAAEG